MERTSKDDGFEAQLSSIIAGTRTEFVFHRFVNSWILIISQYNKIPNVFTVKFDIQRDESIPSAIQGPIDHPDFHMSVPLTIMCNFGEDRDEIRSGIQFLVNKTNLKRSPVDLHITLGLKEINGTILKCVATELDKIIN